MNQRFEMREFRTIIGGVPNFFYTKHMKVMNMGPWALEELGDPCP